MRRGRILAMWLLVGASGLLGCSVKVQDLGSDNDSVGHDELEPGDGKQLAAGGNATCFRRADGVVKCWGQNDFGQLAVETDQMCGLLPCTSQPYSVPALKGASLVAQGGRFGCAILKSGETACFGENTFGELGRGTHDADPHLEPQPLELSGVTGLWLGAHHGCAIDSAGKTWCWGLGEDGQLGIDPTTLERCAVPDDLAGKVGDAGVPATDAACATEPLEVAALAGAVELALGDAHTCARFVDGRVACVGRGSSGQLGDGEASSSMIWTFATVQAIASGADQLAAGARHTCAVLSGRVRCWGDDVAGQLGVGSIDHPTCEGGPCLRSPTLLSDISGVERLALGERFSCASFAKGGAKCWGDDSLGQLGNSSFPNEACKPADGPAFPCLRRPSEPVYDLSDVLELKAGTSHVCALVSGELRCWGSSEMGQGSGTAHVAFPSAVYGLN